MFDVSELECIKELVTESRKNLLKDESFCKEYPDVIEELDHMLQVCNKELKDFYGFAGAMDILLRPK